MHRGVQADTADVLRLQAACDTLATCLCLAQKCSVDSAVQAQLACTGIGCLASSGCAALSAALASPTNTPQWLVPLLASQMGLAAVSMRAPGLTPAAAVDAAPPSQLAAWLNVCVHATRSGGNRETGAQHCWARHALQCMH